MGEENTKIDKKYGVIKLGNEYYKSYAIFIKDEFYKCRLSERLRKVPSEV